jgi:preprotein translocase subunit SecA
MLASLRETTSMVLAHVELRTETADDSNATAAKPAANPAAAAPPQKVTRNAPCPCGSGKKYKHCHGAITA